MKEWELSVSRMFLKSAYTEQSLGLEDEAVLEWLGAINRSADVSVKRTSFSDLKSWSYSKESGSLAHESGRFFSIDGIRVRTNWGLKAEWEQPIINQPEIGYLGFLAKEFNGVLHLLMQAKIEPGNINKAQLSPTLQATKSNFSQVHEGRAPKFLSVFRDAKSQQVLLDQLQSEQGARFLRKRNRNIVVKIDDDIELPPNFIWLTVGQIKSLLKRDNLVNMDSRTVLAGLPFGTTDPDTCSLFSYLKGPDKNNLASDFARSALSHHGALHTTAEIISKITSLKSKYDLTVEKVDLGDVDEWIFGDQEIVRNDRKFFRVIPVDVEIGGREVNRWSQPMIQPAQEGLCAFVFRRINGVLHVAMQLKLECGNHDVLELAPTVQTLTGNYQEVGAGKIPFLDYVLNAPKRHVILDTRQSEEGGRFFQEQNRYVVVVLDEGHGNEPAAALGSAPAFPVPDPDNLPENFIWMTLHQLAVFMKFNNFINIQSRSLIASIPFT